MTDMACAIAGTLVTLVLLILLVLFVVGTALGKHEVYCNCVKQCETCGKVVTK